MTMLGLFTILIFVYAIVSHRLEKTIITAPMIFTLAGVILVWSQEGGTLPELDGKAALVLAEITLAIILFTDGTHINVRNVIRRAQLPTRLLAIAMPLIILVGAVVAALIFDSLSIWEAAILGTLLAATDAGLGHAIVKSPRVPLRIRQALNVEAGLNDGLAVPFLMLFIALAQVDKPLEDRSWILYTAQQIGFGLLVGMVLGWGGGWLTAVAVKRQWMIKTYEQLALLSLAVLSWFVAEKMVGGNAFIAAFVAGLVVKLGYSDAGETLDEFSELWGQLLNYYVFFLFGTIVATTLNDFSVSVVLYALLSLTFIRMLPVSLSMIGTGIQTSTAFFLGWFGPRGLASIVLGLVFLKEKASLPGESIILATVTATVLLSVFAHGMTAVPGISLYARRVEALSTEAPELQEGSHST